MRSIFIRLSGKDQYIEKPRHNKNSAVSRFGAACATPERRRGVDTPQHYLLHYIIPINSVKSYMKLIIGLGNPGKEYEKTRHNVGFAVVDTLAKELGFSNWKTEKRLESEVCRGFIASCCEDVILAKPQTFMNKSGDSIKKLTTYYLLLTTDLLVVHDDLDLPLGTLRLSHGSGAAGHKGVQSIIDALGTKDFWRLRVGVDPTTKSSAFVLRRGQKLSFDASKFVLKRFPRLSQGKVKKVIAATVHAVQLMFQKGPHAAQTEINAVQSPPLS